MEAKEPEQNDEKLKMAQSQPSKQQVWTEERAKNARLENLAKARAAKSNKRKSFLMEEIPKESNKQDSFKEDAKPNTRNNDNWYEPLLLSLLQVAVTTIGSALVASAIGFFTISSDGSALHNAPNNNTSNQTNRNKQEPDIYYNQSIFR